MYIITGILKIPINNERRYIFMSNLNSVNLIGNLVKDVTTIDTSKGTKVSSFTLAVNGVSENDTSYVNIVCFGKLATIVSNYCKKGNKVAVSGSLHTRTYDDKNGNKQFVTEVIALSVEFLTQKNTAVEKVQESVPFVEFPNG